MKREKGKEKICAERMMRHEYIMENDVNMCFFATNTLFIEQTIHRATNKTNRNIDSDTLYG